MNPRNSKKTQMQLAGVLLAAAVLLPVAELQAERAGFTFQGTFSGGPATYSLFGYTIARGSTVTGTFSYDTSTPGVDRTTGVRDYHQSITGGLTLDMMDTSNVPVKVAGSDYIISVANDQGASPIDSFTVEHKNFDSNGMVDTIPPLAVTSSSGTSSWAGIADIKLFLSWPGSTFTDPDEPKLTGNRPMTPGASVVAFVGSANSGAFVAARSFNTSFSITALSPLLGDYNRDGKVDTSDYFEWRKAFGETDQRYWYADGNSNSVIDAADYVVWRDAMAGAGATSFAWILPEPAGLLLASLACISIGLGRRPVRNLPILKRA